VGSRASRPQPGSRRNRVARASLVPRPTAFHPAPPDRVPSRTTRPRPILPRPKRSLLPDCPPDTRRNGRPSARRGDNPGRSP